MHLGIVHATHARSCALCDVLLCSAQCARKRVRVIRLTHPIACLLRVTVRHVHAHLVHCDDDDGPQVTTLKRINYRHLYFMCIIHVCLMFMLLSTLHSVRKRGYWTKTASLRHRRCKVHASDMAWSLFHSSFFGSSVCFAVRAFWLASRACVACMRRVQYVSVRKFINAHARKRVCGRAR